MPSRVLFLAAMFVPAACGGQPFPPIAAASPLAALSVFEAEVERSISVRHANGLRSDHDWVTTVISDSNSLTRYDILVSADEAHRIDELAIKEAIALRTNIGMRADEAWVRLITLDPGSVIRYGIAMTSGEAAAIDDRIKIQTDVAPAIVAYGERFPEEWAGAYIDPTTGNVVASFTGPLEEHRAALLSLFAPGLARVDVRQVQRSTAALDALNAPIWTDAAQAWLKRLGVRVLGGGSRVIENDVHLELAVPMADPSVGRRITEHFHGEHWLTVEMTVPPPPPTRFGDLSIMVVDDTGKPVSGVTCWLHPDIPGYEGDDALRITGDVGDCRWEQLGATAYNVEIWRNVGDGLLGTGRVTVPANGTGQVTITVTAR